MKDMFFIIDSTDLTSVKSNLYGFSFNSNGLVDSFDKFNSENNTFLGAYISVECGSEEIVLSQDFNGSYGIYFFKNENRYVFSNSFFYLVEYIRDKEKISFNYEYHDSLYVTDFCSNSFSETMVNEISILPRDCKVYINRLTGIYRLENNKFEEQTISVLSKKGLDYLDRWFDKWIDIIRSIKEKSNDIIFDLSGGFDSRVLISILLNANVDMDQVCINSFKDKLVCHEEDYEIASQIAKFYNFKLNNKLYENKTISYDPKKVIDNALYIKLGSHKEFYYSIRKYDSPVLKFSGDGGECMRNYWYRPYFLIMKRKFSACKKYPSISSSKVRSFFKCNFNQLSKYTKVSLLNPRIGYMLYRETRCRYHYGRYAVENFAGNICRIQPLLDPDLRKLNCNIGFLLRQKNCFCALVYARYAPDLLNFKIEGGRKIDEKLLKKIKKVNSLYPYKKRNLSFVSCKDNIEKNNGSLNNEVPQFSPYDYFRDMFFSDEFKTEFTKYFSGELYNYIYENKKKVMNIRNPSFRDIYTACGALEVMKSCEMSLNL